MNTSLPKKAKNNQLINRNNHTINESANDLSTPKSKGLSSIDNEIIQGILKKEKEDPEWQSKRRRKRNDSLQSLFLYPAMMVTDGQRDLISIIKKHQPHINNLFDPFMGSGNSLLAGIECGLDCFGQDINPMAVLLTSVKLGTCSPQTLFDSYQEVIFSLNSQTPVEVTTTFPGIDRWFNKEVQQDISRLQQGIRIVKSIDARRFLWVTLAETIRLTSNDRISTYKLHRRKQEEIEERSIDVIKTFSLLSKRNIENIARFQKKLFESRKKYPNVHIALNDCKKGITVGERFAKFDLLVTSPPYGDNRSTIPYGQHSYLPLQWIDLIDINPLLTDDILKTTQQIDSISIGGKGNSMETEKEKYLFCQSNTLKKFISRLRVDHAPKSKKVLNFFGDLEKAIENIAERMSPDSYCIWTVGNRNVGNLEVPNDIIMKEILEKKGYLFLTQIERHIYNKKMPSRNQFSNTMRTEKILILRKRG